MSGFILLLFFSYQGQVLGGTHAALHEFGRVWEYYPPQSAEDLSLYCSGLAWKREGDHY